MSRQERLSLGSRSEGRHELPHAALRLANAGGVCRANGGAREARGLESGRRQAGEHHRKCHENDFGGAGGAAGGPLFDREAGYLRVEEVSCGAANAVGPPITTLHSAANATPASVTSEPVLGSQRTGATTAASTPSASPTAAPMASSCRSCPVLGKLRRKTSPATATRISGSVKRRRLSCRLPRFA